MLVRQRFVIDMSGHGIYIGRCSPREAALEHEDNTIAITSKITVSWLLERAKRAGELRLVDGDDVFILKHQTPVMSDDARQFLIRGGPVSDD